MTPKDKKIVLYKTHMMLLYGLLEKIIRQRAIFSVVLDTKIFDESFKELYIMLCENYDNMTPDELKKSYKKILDDEIKKLEKLEEKECENR